ncbi:MAG TPA: DUF2459 domain-containing protein [candidate division Zixibacteria bacterium]|nr:DUF2459 domain-containing protein [candidate division Zixibacteria bacterium]
MLILAAFAWSCAKPLSGSSFDPGPPGNKRFFVVSHGWHSGIVIKTAEIRARVLPEIADFPGADYLEFGWGDRDYYQHPDPGLRAALKAAFWSSGSVLYVGGVTGDVASYFRGSELYEFSVSEESFDRLVKFIAETFLRPGQGRAAEARPGGSPRSRFYPARGKFSLLRTCNTWVAEALHAAGLAVSPACVVTAGGLARQLGNASGRRLQ